MMLKAQLIWCIDRVIRRKASKQESNPSVKQSDEKILPAPETSPTPKSMSLAHQQTYRMVRRSAETNLLALRACLTGSPIGP
jgi:hypothetical protein